MTAAAASYAIIVCTRCRDPRTGSFVADALLAQLQASEPSDRFVVETVACMAGCDCPLAVAFRSVGKASYLFGDIQPDTDATALREFGALYNSLPDGWSSERQRPDGLRGKTLAHIPASQQFRP